MAGGAEQGAISILPISVENSTDILEGLLQGDLAHAVPGSENVRTIGDANAMVAGLAERTRSGTELHFSVWLEGRKVIGMCALYGFDRQNGTAKIGYWISRAYRGMGYGTSAVRLLVSFAFGTGLAKVYAESEASNLPSAKLLHALGFKDEAGAGEDGKLVFSLART